MGDTGSEVENSSLSSLFIDQITPRENALGFCCLVGCLIFVFMQHQCVFETLRLLLMHLN